MIDDRHPDDVDTDAGEALGQGGLTRRQLLVSGAVLGVAATAAGSILTNDALAGSRGDKRCPPGTTDFPDLGYPMPGDMRPQLTFIQNLVPALGFASLGLPDTEADECPLAQHAGSPGADCPEGIAPSC